MKLDKYSARTPAQSKAQLRNRLKGSTAMMKGMIFWMLREECCKCLSQNEKLLLKECLFNLQEIIKKWRPTL